MEIERKWMVNGWPSGLPLLRTQRMRQGYLSVRPTVRIREESETGGETAYVLCFKSKGKEDGLAREEIEIRVEEEVFRGLERIVGIPLVEKERRDYALDGGLILEVSDVDEGRPTHFMYAEIEYPSVEAAREWQPQSEALAAYLADDVTDQPGQTMGAYWELTRLRETPEE